MLTREENERLIQVGPGTPGGEFNRRYWQPAALSEELPPGGAPLPIRVERAPAATFASQARTDPPCRLAASRAPRPPGLAAAARACLSGPVSESGQITCQTRADISLVSNRLPPAAAGRLPSPHVKLRAWTSRSVKKSP